MPCFIFPLLHEGVTYSNLRRVSTFFDQMFSLLAWVLAIVVDVMFYFLFIFWNIHYYLQSRTSINNAQMKS